MKLAAIIEKEIGTIPSTTKLAKSSGLAVSTTNDALNREIDKTSFGIIVKILRTVNISIDTVAELYTSEHVTPSQAERVFLSQADLKQRTIMGIQFSSADKFWQARDLILDTIYEGVYPTKDSVQRLMERIEHKKSSDELISQLRETYGKESL